MDQGGAPPGKLDAAHLALVHATINDGAWPKARHHTCLKILPSWPLLYNLHPSIYHPTKEKYLKKIAEVVV